MGMYNSVDISLHAIHDSLMCLLIMIKKLIMSNDVLQGNKVFDFKVLFGPMFGCEFHLPAGSYFFIVGSERSSVNSPGTFSDAHTFQLQHVAHYSHNTLYLPCEDASAPNFILHLSSSMDNNEESCLKVEFLDPAGSSNFDIAENEAIRHNGVSFVIKDSHSDWESETLSHEQYNSHSKIKAQPSTTKINRRRVLTIFLPFLVAITLFFVWYDDGQNNSEKRISDINAYLSGSPTPFSILKGRDGTSLYLLVQDYQGMEWLQEAILKYEYNHNITVLLAAQKSKEIINRLHIAGEPVLQLDLDSPQHPVISLYQQLAPANEKKLRERLLQELPFANDITVKTVDKKQLLDYAKQGIDKLHIYSKVITTANGYSLNVHQKLSDSQLLSLRNFIHQFSEQWGNEIINFSFILDENWLNNMSYVNSADGYLFLAPQHWYFPLTNEGLNYVK